MGSTLLTADADLSYVKKNHGRMVRRFEAEASVDRGGELTAADRDEAGRALEHCLASLY